MIGPLQSSNVHHHDLTPAICRFLCPTKQVGGAETLPASTGNTVTSGCVAFGVLGVLGCWGGDRWGVRLTALRVGWWVAWSDRRTDGCLQPPTQTNRVEIDKSGDTEWKVRTQNVRCGVCQRRRPHGRSIRRSESRSLHNPPRHDTQQKKTKCCGIC